MIWNIDKIVFNPNHYRLIIIQALYGVKYNSLSMFYYHTFFGEWNIAMTATIPKEMNKDVVRMFCTCSSSATIDYLQNQLRFLFG